MRPFKLVGFALLALSSSPLALHAQTTSVKPTQTQLQEVALTGQGGTAGTAPSTHLDADQIARTQAASLQDVLRDVPAVATSRRGNLLNNGVTMRGFGGDHHYPGDPATKIVVDGVGDTPGRHYQSATGSIADPALLASVDVTTGPLASLEFGSGITGGAISAKTINGGDLTEGRDGFRFRQLLGANSNGDGSVSSSTLAWQANERFDLLVNFTRRQQDVQQDGNGKDLALEGFNVPSLLLKARMRIDEANTLTFSHNRFESAERGVPYSSTIGLPALGLVNRDREGGVTSLTWNFAPKGSALWDLELKASRSDQDHNVTALSPGFASSAAGKFNIVTDRITLANTARFETAGIQHSLRAGLGWSSEKRKRLETRPASGTDRRLSLFAINTMDFGDDLRGTIGLRIEDQKLNGTTTALGPYSNLARTLGAGLEKGLGNGMTVFGSVTYTEALPSYDLLADGNGGKLQQSRNYELGLKYEGSDLFGAGDRLTGSITGYSNYVWNAVYAFNRNMDFKGIEVAADYRMASGTYMRGAVKLSDHQQITTAGVWDKYTYNTGNTMNVTVGHAFASGLDLSWTAQAQESLTIGSATHAGFAAHDLKASYTAQSGVLAGVTVDFGIENVFDKTYHHSITPLVAATGLPYVNEPGRNIRLSLSKTF